MNRYSANEIALFTALDLGYMLPLASLEPPSLYRTAVEKAFLSNLQGPVADALRRGATALFAGLPYRMTPEFEALVEIKG